MDELYIYEDDHLISECTFNIVFIFLKVVLLHLTDDYTSPRRRQQVAFLNNTLGIFTTALIKG